MCIKPEKYLIRVTAKSKIWKKENSNTFSTKLRRNSKLQVRIELTTDPPSSSLDALTFELLEALHRAGSKFNYKLGA